MVEDAQDGSRRGVSPGLGLRGQRTLGIDALCKLGGDPCTVDRSAWSHSDPRQAGKAADSLKTLWWGTTELRMRAEIRAGELLDEMVEKGERHRQGGTGANQSQKSQRATSAPTLKELGVTKSQSSRWQQLAALPKEEQEEKEEKMVQSPTY